MPPERYDIIIIGTGAGGATLSIAFFGLIAGDFGSAIGFLSIASQHWLRCCSLGY